MNHSANYVPFSSLVLYSITLLSPLTVLRKWQSMLTCYTGWLVAPMFMSKLWLVCIWFLYSLFLCIVLYLCVCWSFIIYLYKIWWHAFQLALSYFCPSNYIQCFLFLLLTTILTHQFLRYTFLVLYMFPLLHVKHRIVIISIYMFNSCCCCCCCCCYCYRGTHVR